jgi:hypothetical protein
MILFVQINHIDVVQAGRPRGPTLARDSGPERAEADMMLIWPEVATSPSSSFQVMTSRNASVSEACPSVLAGDTVAPSFHDPMARTDNLFVRLRSISTTREVALA